MLEALYSAVYVRVLLLFILPYATVQIMSLMGKGRHPYLSLFIGAGLGVLAMWAMPLSIVPNIVSVIGAIGGNIVLTNIVFPKINDKLGDVVDKGIAKGRDRDYQIILNGSEQSERVKYLARYITRGGYVFTLNVTPKTAYEAVLRQLGEASVKKIHPQAKLSDAINGDNYIIRLECPRVTIGFLAEPIADTTKVTLLLADIKDDGLGLRESMALETENTMAFDNFYVFVRPILSSLDANCNISFA